MSNRTGRMIVIVVVGAALAAACGSSSKKSSPTATVANNGNTTTSYASSAVTTANVDLHLATSGSINGSAFNGDITPSQLSCVAANANNTLVRWSGDVMVDGKPESISGDMTLQNGSQDLTGSGASLVLNGDYKNSLGSAAGTANVAADGKSGSIDAKLSGGTDNATLKGDWKCS